MVRRLAALVVVVSATALGGSGAAADAPANENNCAGAFASGLLPDLAAADPGTFGAARRAAAQEGTVDDTERMFTDLLASCGEP